MGIEEKSVFRGYLCLKLRGLRNSPGLRLRAQKGDADRDNAGLRGGLVNRTFLKFSAIGDKFDVAILVSHT